MNTIRIATTKDIPLIRQLAEQVFPETYKNIITPEQCRYMMDMMYSEESLRRQMTEEGHVYQLLSVDGEAAGYVSVQPIESDLYELQKIYMLPRFQGRHLGRTLFDAAVALVKKLHPEPCRIFLHVNRYNKAKTFYEHLGLKVTKQGDYDIGHGYFMNDYIMEKEI
ncbi:MAG: GNAT family N-acetyltransferase [Bacteroidales bacterium]|nr:GNAT family N-acetyltransferase [Bacteroidales bacterium]MCI7653716.1 GNAT family N-acetyltransferase [Bacteroidales bacterium]MDY4952134.1 GNAT family N-acetyltransferase [Prevotella sp.]